MAAVTLSTLTNSDLSLVCLLVGICLVDANMQSRVSCVCSSLRVVVAVHPSHL